MDIDRFIAANTATWERLGSLTARSRRHVRDLDPDELAELVRLYQRTSSHLSYARTYYGDPSLLARLTGLVAAAGSVVYGTRPRTSRAFGHFATATFPAAVWHVRRFVAVSALLLLVPFAATAVWIATSEDALEASAPAAVRATYVDRDFEAYYSSGPAAAFTAQVFTNNVRVAILAFAAGILLCVVSAGLLAYNGAAVGVAAGLFTAAGAPGRFWGLILPHGLLELSAVIVAGAAGLALGWAVIVPGDRSRRDALAEQGRRSVSIVLGLVVAFLVAGLIEGYVTGQPWPTTLRVAIGVVAWSAFTAYVVVLGRAAAARGMTGLLGEADERSEPRHRRSALSATEYGPRDQHLPVEPLVRARRRAADLRVDAPVGLARRDGPDGADGRPRARGPVGRLGPGALHRRQHEHRLRVAQARRLSRAVRGGPWP